MSIRSDSGDERQATFESVRTEVVTRPAVSTAGKVLYDFPLFIKQLQDPRAAPIVKFTKSFIKNFITKRLNWNVNEQVKLIADFKVFIYDKLMIYEPFQSMSPELLNNAKEGLEKLVMGKLYGRCFSPNLVTLGSNLDEMHMQDIKDDCQFKKKVLEFGFIELSELDSGLHLKSASLEVRLGKFMDLARIELNKIERYKSPRDKMVCVLNCCKVIFGLLKHDDSTLSKGADIFIPFLIYCLLNNTQGQWLISHVRYIDRFRHPALLRGEESYYLSSLQGAMSFIMDMTVENLTVTDHNEFQQRYDRHQDKIKPTISQIDNVWQEAKNGQTGEATEGLTLSPYSGLESIMKPIDEMTNIMASKINELWSYEPANESITENEAVQVPNPIDATEGATQEHQRHETVAGAIRKIEERDRKDTLASLHAMFPEMDLDLIEDVCLAQKYRIGTCVDALLSLST